MRRESDFAAMELGGLQFDNVGTEGGPRKPKRAKAAKRVASERCGYERRFAFFGWFARHALAWRGD